MDSQQILLEKSLSYEEYQPGLLIETYQTRVSRSGIIVFWILIIVLLALVGGMVILFVFLFLPLLRDPFFPPSPTYILLSIVLPFLLFAFQISAVFWQLRTHDSFITPIRRKIIVSLYTGGIVYCEGRRQQMVTWEQTRVVERLVIKRWNTLSRYYKLLLEDESEIVLSIAIAHVDELGAAIEREIVKLRLPQIQADYVANKPIVFTGLCLTRESISNSDESLPWEAVERISFGIEKLTIKEREGDEDWMVAPMVQFRNACLLEALLEQIGEEKGFELIKG